MLKKIELAPLIPLKYLAGIFTYSVSVAMDALLIPAKRI